MEPKSGPPNVLDLIADGWDPTQATKAIAAEEGEPHGCTGSGDAPQGVISADELAELDAPE